MKKLCSICILFFSAWYLQAQDKCDIRNIKADITSLKPVISQAIDGDSLLTNLLTGTGKRLSTGYDLNCKSLNLPDCMRCSALLLIKKNGSQQRTIQLSLTYEQAQAGPVGVKAIEANLKALLAQKGFQKDESRSRKTPERTQLGYRRELSKNFLADDQLLGTRKWEVMEERVIISSRSSRLASGEKSSIQIQIAKNDRFIFQEKIPESEQKEFESFDALMDEIDSRKKQPNSTTSALASGADVQRDLQQFATAIQKLANAEPEFRNLRGKALSSVSNSTVIGGKVKRYELLHISLPSYSRAKEPLESVVNVSMVTEKGYQSKVLQIALPIRLSNKYEEAKAWSLIVGELNKIAKTSGYAVDKGLSQSTGAAFKKNEKGIVKKLGASTLGGGNIIVIYATQGIAIDPTTNKSIKPDPEKASASDVRNDLDEFRYLIKILANAERGFRDIRGEEYYSRKGYSIKKSKSRHYKYDNSSLPTYVSKYNPGFEETSQGTKPKHLFKAEGRFTMHFQSTRDAEDAYRSLLAVMKRVAKEAGYTYLKVKQPYSKKSKRYAFQKDSEGIKKGLMIHLDLLSGENPKMIRIIATQTNVDE